MKNILRIHLAAIAAAVSAVAVAQDIALAEARAKIGDAVTDPAVMTATMKQLSAADQKAFLAECNQAIDKMPGSNEEKTATYLNANKAALKGAKKGNVSNLLAEVFATVPPEALTVINERFAADLFNRAADPSVTYTDEQFLQISYSVMTNIAARLEGTDNADVRGTFAALMLLRASNASSAELAELMARATASKSGGASAAGTGGAGGTGASAAGTGGAGASAAGAGGAGASGGGSLANLMTLLVGTLPESSRDVAANEWIPAALAEGGSQSYEAMLGAADAGQTPNIGLAIRIAGPQQLESMLADLAGTGTDPMVSASGATPITDAVLSPINTQVPSLGSGDANSGSGSASATPASYEQSGQSEPSEPSGPPAPTPSPEPGPYPLGD